MVTRFSGQGTTAAPACALMVPAARGSLQEVVTVVTTLSRPSVSATKDIKVKALLRSEIVSVRTKQSQVLFWFFTSFSFVS